MIDPMIAKVEAALAAMAERDRKLRIVVHLVMPGVLYWGGLVLLMFGQGTAHEAGQVAVIAAGGSWFGWALGEASGKWLRAGRERR